MTSAPSHSGFVAELIQSRSANASEALAIMRNQGAALRRRLAAVRGYRLARLAWLASFVGALAIIMLAIRMHWIPRMSLWVYLPLWLAISFSLCRLWGRYASRVCAEVYQEALKGDCRLRLEADGIVISGPGTVASVSWSAIRDIVANKDYITLYLSAIHTVSFPVATFEGQDVESFVAELERRWQASRAPAGTAA